jgi:hypothetical protein
MKNQIDLYRLWIARTFGLLLIIVVAGVFIGEAITPALFRLLDPVSRLLCR